MGFKSYDYECQLCEHTTIELVDRGDDPDIIECPECGGGMHAQFGAPTVMNASLPDGNGRFESMKIRNKLNRERAEAKSRRDLATADKIKKEMEKVK